MRWFCSFLILLAPYTYAEMFIWTDSNGVKHFSDRPPQAQEASTVKGKVTVKKAPSSNLNLMQAPPLIQPPADLPNSESEQNSGIPSEKSAKTPDSHSLETDLADQPQSKQKKDKDELRSKSQSQNDYQNAARNYNETHKDTPIPEGHNKQARILTAKEKKKENRDNYKNNKKNKLSQKLKKHNAAKKK